MRETDLHLYGARRTSRRPEAHSAYTFTSFSPLFGGKRRTAKCPLQASCLPPPGKPESVLDAKNSMGGNRYFAVFVCFGEEGRTLFLPSTFTGENTTVAWTRIILARPLLLFLSRAIFFSSFLLSLISSILYQDERGRPGVRRSIRRVERAERDRYKCEATK